MPGISRVGLDTAGGLILGGGQSKVYLEGYLIAVFNDNVASHGSGSHSSAKINTGSSKFFINNKAVCRAGDSATCGHLATGSSKGFSG